MDKRKFFKEYLKKDILKNNSFDCSEIADDFYNEFKEGYLINITVKGNPNKFFHVIENGEQVQCIYHTIYSDGEYVYDPRYANEPIKKEKYLEDIQKMNKESLNIQYE